MPIAFGFPIGFRPENTRLYKEKATTLCNGTRQGFTSGVVRLANVYDARGNGDGKTVNTITGDHNNRVTDYSSVVCVAYSIGNGQTNQISMSEQCNTIDCMHDKQAVLIACGRIPHIVRRLTPIECARLQGFADRWGDIDPKEDFTDEEYRFWMEVRNTHAAINGKAVKEYTKAQMLTWYNKLHTDSAEYKMWGNGIALPTALYVMQGITDALVASN